jgi:peptidyl-tRNA hydrolase
VEVNKRLREWWFKNEQGKVCVSIKYGSQLIELAKGKHSVEVDTAQGLIKALEQIKSAVEQGELDAQIATASVNLRKGFGK